MIMARAVAALAACAAAFERVCPGDQPTNVSDTIFKERVVANNWIEGRALLLPAVVLDEGVPGAARPAEFARVAG